MEHRMNRFKNRGDLKTDELRRRREDAAVEIRKQKREENLAKRRNLHNIDSDDDLDESFNVEVYIAHIDIFHIYLFIYNNYKSNCIFKYLYLNL